MTEHEIKITVLKVTDAMSLRTGRWISKTKYRAVCKCGWVSVPRASRVSAEAEGDDHRMAIRDEGE